METNNLMNESMCPIAPLEKIKISLFMDWNTEITINSLLMWIKGYTAKNNGVITGAHELQLLFNDINNEMHKVKQQLVKNDTYSIIPSENIAFQLIMDWNTELAIYSLLMWIEGYTDKNGETIPGSFELCMLFRQINNEISRIKNSQLTKDNNETK